MVEPQEGHKLFSTKINRKLLYGGMAKGTVSKEIRPIHELV